MLGQPARVDDRLEVDIDDCEVRRWRWLSRVVLLEERVAFHDTCICEDEVKPTFLIEDGLEDFGQAIVVCYVDFVEGALDFFRRLLSTLSVEIEQMKIPAFPV